MFEGIRDRLYPLSDLDLAKKIIELEGILKLTRDLNGSTDKRGAQPTYSDAHIRRLNRSLRKLKKIEADRRKVKERYVRLFVKS